MPSAIILIADGTEEIEFTIPYDVLVRAGFAVESIGVNLQNTYAVCSRNVKIVPDSTQLPTTPEADILILPGGAAGAKTFASTSAVQSLIRAYRDADKYVGVICASTTALVASAGDTGKTEGLESGRKVKVTSHPSVKDQVVSAGWDYSENRVVVDGKVITTRGPGTTMGFALKIVELMVGESKRREVAEPMMCADVLIGGK